MCKRMNIDARCDKSPVRRARPIPSQPSRTHSDQSVPFTHNASTHAHETKRHRRAHAPRPFQKPTQNQHNAWHQLHTNLTQRTEKPKNIHLVNPSLPFASQVVRQNVKYGSFRFAAVVDNGVGCMTVGCGCEEDVSVDEERACTVAGSR